MPKPGTGQHDGSGMTVQIHFLFVLHSQFVETFLFDK